MGNISFISGIVKILESPKQKSFDGNILITQFRVQFPQVRNKLVVTLTFWSNLAADVANYYKVTDYILIEGYFSTQTDNLNFSTLKKFNITVLKVYPFRLTSN